MRAVLLVLSALVGLALGYIQLEPVDYVQLQDRAGGLSLNASTYNRLSWDDLTNIVYVLAHEPARLTVFSLTSAGTLNQLNNIDLSGSDIGLPNDISFCRPEDSGATARLAISFDDAVDPSQPGTVRLYEALTITNPDLNELVRFAVGPNPVDMKFVLDCRRLLVVNTGRPFRRETQVTDPAGSVNKVDMPGVLDANSLVIVSTIGFAPFLEAGDGSDNVDVVGPLMELNFRRTPIRDDNNNLLSISQNMEPVNVEVAPNGQTAYVAMPKNNAIARLNMDLEAVTDIIPMGRRSWSEFYMDASQADNVVHMESYDIYSTLQPRQVKWVSQGDTEWLITMDSGFLDTIPEYSYADYDTGSNLMSSGEITGADAELQGKLLDDSRLGQAYISTVDGRGASGESIEELYMFGGRGISIHDAVTLDIRTSLVDNLERVSAQFYSQVFNTAYTTAANTPQQDRDATSPTYGPNLSEMETGDFDNNRVIFLASGTSGMIYVYVLVADADCPQPFFHSVYRAGGVSSSWQTLYGAGNIGDLGISDMLYVGESPDHERLLLVTGSTSNSISVYRVVDNPTDLRRRAADQQ